MKKGGNLQGLSRSSQSTQAFEAALPLILENVSKHFCKVTGENLQVIGFFIDHIDKPIFMFIGAYRVREVGFHRFLSRIAHGSLDLHLL